MDTRETPFWKRLRFWAVVQAVAILTVIVIYGYWTGIQDMLTLSQLILAGCLVVTIVTSGLYLRWRLNRDSFRDQGWEW